MTWRLSHGPWFGSALATVHIDGSEAYVRWEAADTEKTFRNLGRAPIAGRP